MDTEKKAKNHEVLDVKPLPPITGVSAGIQHVPAELIYQQQPVALQICLIRGLCPLSDSDFDMFCGPLVRAVVQNVHLVPATEAHHYRGQMGLLLHSLDTARRALIGAKAETETWGTNSEKPDPVIYQVAAFVAGFLQDIATPYASFWVQSEESGQCWDHAKSLVGWLEHHGVSRYHIAWKPMRQDAHQQKSLEVAETLLHDELRQYLTPIWGLFTAAFSYPRKRSRGLAKIISRANQESISQNLACYNELRLSEGSLPPCGYQFLLWMDAHVKNGDWTVNQLESNIFITKNLGVCIDLPGLCSSNHHHAPGEFPPLPRSSRGVRRHLEDISMIRFRRVERNGVSESLSYWKVQFSLVVDGEIVLHQRKVLRLRDRFGLFASGALPEVVDAKIIC